MTTITSDKQACSLCLALDFGGTKLAAGLVDWQAGTVLRQARCATSGMSNASQQITAMQALVERELRLEDAERSALGGIGVSFGGPVDAASGRVLLSHHVPGWEDVPLVERLHEIYGLPVQMENDANAVALGEHRYGAGRGVDNLVYLTISTGIGGGLILDGQLRRGEHGLAGEIGHMVVRPNGPDCTCGNRGCLEALASGVAIADRARQALAHCTGSAMLRLAGGDPQAITAEIVFRAAAAGDPGAAWLIEQVAEDLGLALAMLASIVDPGRIILGGGVAKAGEQLLRPVRSAFQRYAFPMLAERVSIVQAAALDEGGLLGAAALVARATTYLLQSA